MNMPEEISINKSITIHKKAPFLYKLWRNPEYLPQILDFLEEVIVLDENRSEWSVVVAQNERISWNTEITEEIAPQLLRWHSENSPYVLHQALIRFTEKPPDSTDLFVNLRFYFPPMEDSRPNMLGDDIAQRIEEDLYRFKIAVEGNDFPRKKEVRKGLPQDFPGKRRITPKKSLE